MLKILIIDDDTFTRKGIQMLMPWDKYDMKIVGEASNGKIALEFLKENEVDLALVDIDMPIMNGIAFIQEASRLYPRLNYVVLTIHTEFEYIQNVLRLGAIDYIAKTQFDQENFDQILNRIQASIAKKNQLLESSGNTKWRESKILYHNIYALLSTETNHEEIIGQFLDLNGIAEGSGVYELMSNVLVFTSDQTDFIFPEIFTNTTLLCISDVNDLTYNQLSKLLSKYVKEQYFYDYQPLKCINFKRAHELLEDTCFIDDETLARLKAEWISLNWVHEKEVFQKMCLNLENSKLKFSSLYHLLLSLEAAWNLSFSKLTGFRLSLPESFRNWYEVEAWLMNMYEQSNLYTTSTKYSADVTRNILSVKNYVNIHYSDSFDAAEISRYAGMSYGYFSRCFHDIVGISFSEYCTIVRVNKAKEALQNTGNTIQQIAFDVGYNDEKYFSRIFRKNTGLSPSEFRKRRS